MNAYNDSFDGNREENVIGSLIAQPSLIGDVIDEDLTADDFYHSHYKDQYPNATRTPAALAAAELRRDTFDVISQLHSEGTKVTETRVRRLLTSAKRHSAPTVRAFMSRLRLDEPHPNFGDELRWVTRAAERRAAQREAAGEVDDELAPPPQRFESMSLADLAKSDRRIEYFIPGILAQRQSALTFGREKDCKTLLMADAAASIATGAKFLNHFEVTKTCPVYFASGENGPDSLLEYFRRVFRSKDVDPASVDNFTVTTELPRFYVDADLQLFEKRIGNAGAELVVVDPAAVCMSPAAASTLSVAYSELRAITDCCSRVGATLILIHHSSRASSIAQQGLRAAAGAGFPEWARQWITVDRLGSFKPKTGEHRLRLSVGGSAGHGGQWIVDIREGNQADKGGRVWDVKVHDVDPKKAAKAGDAVRRNADAIFAKMQELGRPESGRVIRGSLNGERFRPAVNLLIGEGVIRECTIQKAGSEVAGYELTGEARKADG